MGALNHVYRDNGMAQNSTEQKKLSTTHYRDVRIRNKADREHENRKGCLVYFLQQVCLLFRDDSFNIV